MTSWHKGESVRSGSYPTHPLGFYHGHAPCDHLQCSLCGFQQADHYENLYGVVRGTKIFQLLPPSDIYRLHVRCRSGGGNAVTLAKENLNPYCMKHNHS